THPEWRHAAGWRRGGLDRLGQTVSQLYGPRSVGRGGENREVAAVEATDGVRRTPTGMEQRRDGIEGGEGGGPGRPGRHFDAERHTGERRMAAERVGRELPRPAFQPPRRVQPARL